MMKKHNKSPRIYLIFTDLPLVKALFKFLHKHKKPIRLMVLLYIALIMFFMFAVSFYSLYDSYKKKQEIDKKRQEIVNNILYWEKVVDKYKDFRDGYFQLAVLEYRIRNFDKSKHYLDKVLALDPNFAQGRKLEEILNTK